MDRLTRLMANDGTAMSAWSGIPDPFYLGMLVRTSFDVITLDMQHNMHSEYSVLNSLATLTP
ncbi:MAG: 2,4-dihydroxyhept-2-ene-1,7-dioic acid aldolase, partial [Pseudomonadota bacterium]